MNPAPYEKAQAFEATVCGSNIQLTSGMQVTCRRRSPSHATDFISQWALYLRTTWVRRSSLATVCIQHTNHSADNHHASRLV